MRFQYSVATPQPSYSPLTVNNMVHLTISSFQKKFMLIKVIQYMLTPSSDFIDTPQIQNPRKYTDDTA